MGLFEDLDVASAKDDPFKIEPDRYDAVLSRIEADVKLQSQPGKKYIRLYFKIQGGEYNSREIQDLKWIPTNRDLEANDPDHKEKANNAASFLKQRLTQLGVPEDEMNTVEVGDLVGLEVNIRTSHKNGYNNIDFGDDAVTLRNGAPVLDADGVSHSGGINEFLPGS